MIKKKTSDSGEQSTANMGSNNEKALLLFICKQIQKNTTFIIINQIHEFEYIYDYQINNNVQVTH